MITKEIIDASGVHHRLTITPDRMTIKHPVGSSQENRSRVERFFNGVVEKIEPVKIAFRGCIEVTNDPLLLVLQSDSKKQVMEFTEGA